MSRWLLTTATALALTGGATAQRQNDRDNSFTPSVHVPSFGDSHAPAAPAKGVTYTPPRNPPVVFPSPRPVVTNLPASGFASAGRGGTAAVAAAAGGKAVAAVAGGVAVAAGAGAAAGRRKRDDTNSPA